MQRFPATVHKFCIFFPYSVTQYKRIDMCIPAPRYVRTRGRRKRMVVLENKRMHVTDRKLARVSCLNHGASLAPNFGHAASSQRFLKNSVFRSHFERIKANPLKQFTIFSNSKGCSEVLTIQSHRCILTVMY